MKIFNDKALVTKSNNLVEARYHFSIWETRVFTKLVSLIQPSDKDLHNYRLYIKDLVQFFGVNDKDAYTKIKEVPESLLKKVVTIPYTNEDGEMRFLKTGLIAQATIPEKREGYIEMSFHPTLKPYLLQLQQTFLSYDIRNVLKISSVYSIRIYELLKQYETIGTREFDLLELKQILGISDKYKLYGHFKDRIIAKAQKDLYEYTDILFEFSEKKKGRKVVGLVFNIAANDKNKQNMGDDLMFPEENRLTRITKQRLTKWGIDHKKQQELIRKHGVEHVSKAVTYVWNQHQAKLKRGGKIDNLAAYFLSVVTTNNLVDTVEEEKKQQKAKTVQKQNNEASRKQLKQQLNQLLSAMQNAEQQLIKQLFVTDKTRVEHLLNAVKTAPNSFYDNTLSVRQNLQERTFFRTYFLTQVRKTFTTEFEPINTQFLPQIEALKAKLKQLN